MAKKQCYVVLVGEKPGIYASWAECEAQVKGWKGAKYKGFGKKNICKHLKNIPVEAGEGFEDTD